MKKLEIANVSTYSVLVDCGMNSAIAACAQEKMDVEALIKAIDNSDKAALMTINGVAEKRALQIISKGKTLLEELRKAVKCRIWYYMAESYETEQMLDDYEVALLNEAAGFNSDTPLSQAKELLECWLNYENDMASIIPHARGAGSMDSLPSSMMAYNLGIEPDTSTDKVVLYKHEVSNLLRITYNRKKATRKEKGDLNRLIGLCRAAFLHRFERNGFVTENGKRYMSFTHSPSQLKKESGYFLLDTEVKKHPEMLWHGMSPAEISSSADKINVDEFGREVLIGTVSPTKILQYRALWTSAAVPSSEVFGKPIDMSKIIVVKDYEKMTSGDVMSVSSDYEVTEGHRDDIKNPLWDGQAYLNARLFGLILAQLRAIGFKGLAVGTDIVSICKKRGYKPVITDINGVEHDLETEDWHLIADPSTLKMLKLFGGAGNYIEALKRLGMTEAFVCAIDGEEKEYNTLSRQMFSSLFDIEDEELRKAASRTIEELTGMKTLSKATSIMAEEGVYWHRKSNMGKLVSALPDVMALEAVQTELKDRFRIRMDSSRAGKIAVNGKYLFAVLDPVAWVDVAIGGKDPADESIGVLRAGEVSCPKFPIGNELIALRSPHAAHEWTVLRNMKHYVDVAPGCICFNAHDLTFRVLQMDFDGDHILVVDDAALAKAVRRMQKKYNIPVIYYEASKTDSFKPIPRTRDAWADYVTDCVLKCKQYDKVGEYSNYVCAAWSQIMPDMPYDWVRATLRTIAQLAAGINHAVDAQKTFAMDFLDYDFCQQFKFKPHNQRFHAASDEMPSNHPEWNKITLPRGKGSVDRLAQLIDDCVDVNWSLDTSSLKFDWHMMLDSGEQYKHQIWAAIVPQHIRDLIASYGKVKGENETKTYDSIMKGDKVGLVQMFRMLNQQNKTFFAAYKASHEGEDGAEVELNKLKTNRNEVIREIVTEFVRVSHTPGVETMDDKQLLSYAAMQLLRNTFTYKTNNWQIASIFRVFGDIYADTASSNKGAALCALPEAELNAILDSEYPAPAPQEENGFDIEAYAIPEETESLDAFLYNELSDLY